MSAPEPHRRVIAGSGWQANASGSFGIPYMVHVNPADPPILESEAAFLRRHGLLLPGESRRLRAKDYKPETWLPEQPDEEHA